MNENKDKKDATPKGWKPETPSAEEALIDDERSLDIGESGQFAPGGYYNQQGVNKPDRKMGRWDDDVAPPGRL